MTGFIEFIGANLGAMLFGAVIIEALLEIIGDFLPGKYSVAGARALGALIGIAIAFAFNISIVPPDGGSFTALSFTGTVIAGLVMSRGSEYIHAFSKSIINLPYLITARVNNIKQTTTAVQPPELNADSH